MRVRKNGKVITLTESDLMRITRKVLKEQEETKKASASMDPDMAKLFFRMGWFKEDVADKINPNKTMAMDLTVSKDLELQGMGTIESQLKELCKEGELSSNVCGDEKKLFALGRAAQNQFKKLDGGKQTIKIGKRFTY